MHNAPAEFLPQIEPWFGEEEVNAVAEYLRSGGWLTEFKKTRDLERAIADYTGSKHCSVVSNGTVSLTLALLAYGIGPGDEVIVPDYTMVATPNAVALAGAEVVFADIEPESLCLDLQSFEARITPRTKAVIVVSVNGRYPRSFDAIAALCKEKNIRLIEDAAQSLGSMHNGKPAGTLGDIGSFSFSYPKIITTGQGGALITEDDAAIERIVKLRDFGRSAPGVDHYMEMGWNFKFTDLQAVIGIEQMKKVPARVERKRKIYALYETALRDVPGITFLPTDLAEVTPWCVDILVPAEKRQALIDHLKAKHIGSRVFYPALHAEPVYARRESHPVAERVAKEGLWLPSSMQRTDEEIAYVCDMVREFFAH